jgi:hypothetical protein
VALPSNATDGAFGAGRPTRRPTGSRVRGHQITERDVEILRWIARHGVVTAELVGRRFFWRPDRSTYGKWATYRRLAALEHMRLIIRTRSYGYPLPVLRVTRQGAHIADTGLRPAPLVASQLRHTLALVWLTEYLLTEHAGSELVTERELRAQRYRDLRNGDREIEHGRAPDALLHLPARDASAPTETVAIELDVSRKDRRAMERMVRQYDRESVDHVWWFVRPVQVERTRQLVHQLHADDRIEVRQWLA